MMGRYRGADWIKTQTYGANISSFGEKCADILGEVFCGIYHMQDSFLERAEWDNDRVINVTHCGELATFDGDELTMLVLLAHKMNVSVRLTASTHRYMNIKFLAVTRSGFFADKHPDIDEMLTKIKRR